MARKEEILNKAIEFVDKCYVNVGIKTTHEASVAACQDIAEWSDKTMLDSVCEYLKKLVYQEYPGGPLVRKIDDEELKDLRKAMEE